MGTPALTPWLQRRCPWATQQGRTAYKVARLRVFERARNLGTRRPWLRASGGGRRLWATFASPKFLASSVRDRTHNPEPSRGTLDLPSYRGRPIAQEDRVQCVRHDMERHDVSLHECGHSTGEWLLLWMKAQRDTAWPYQGTLLEYGDPEGW